MRGNAKSLPKFRVLHRRSQDAKNFGPEGPTFHVWRGRSGVAAAGGRVAEVVRDIGSRWMSESRHKFGWRWGFLKKQNLISVLANGMGLAFCRVTGFPAESRTNDDQFDR
jgi:hypothetical protein